MSSKSATQPVVLDLSNIAVNRRTEFGLGLDRLLHTLLKSDEECLRRACDTVRPPLQFLERTSGEERKLMSGKRLTLLMLC